jgi:O-glycosyl hydrolase
MKKGIVLAGLLLAAQLIPHKIFCQGKSKPLQAILKIEGSKKLQTIDGIGVNANTRSWNADELKPAIHLLFDSMRLNIWRVIVETVEKWEEVNDDNDPFHFNWNYYDSLYETPKFQKAWDMIAYLNQLGITDNLMINFMGYVPAWMGEETVKPEFEEEYVEMIVSFFYYAKNKRHLQFGLISPTNESDWRKEGPKLDARHYASVMHKLVERMAANEMQHIKYVGPDPADMKAGIREYIPELLKDTVIMKRMARFGVHSYAGYYASIDSMIKKSPYPSTGYWVTEWNAWRDGLDDGIIGQYDYEFAAQSVNYLIDLLRHGANSAMIWEGYDSYYEHHAPSKFSYWGILGFDSSSSTYTPRKHVYAISQVSKFVAPGSMQVQSTITGKNLSVIAFLDPSSGKTIITGVNRNKQPVALSIKLFNLHPTKKFEMYYTDSAVNLQQAGDVTNNGLSFTVTIKPDCIFTLASKK